MVLCPYRANIRWWISTGFTPSAQRNRTRPRYSSMVQSCKRASMFSPSLLPLDWRQSAVLHMAELFNPSVFLRRRRFRLREVDDRPELTFISNTCSTRFKPFHPIINLSLTHGALSILNQHTAVNFHRFQSFCPKKPHYATLFFDDAILQRRIHVFALVAATRLKEERCIAVDWTLQQAFWIVRNVPAPLHPG